MAHPFTNEFRDVHLFDHQFILSPAQPVNQGKKFVNVPVNRSHILQGCLNQRLGARMNGDFPRLPLRPEGIDRRHQPVSLFFNPGKRPLDILIRAA